MSPSFVHLVQNVVKDSAAGELSGPVLLSILSATPNTEVLCTHPFDREDERRVTDAFEGVLQFSSSAVNADVDDA